MQTSTGWIGGSHLANGNKTAQTVGFKVFVDGLELLEGAKVYGRDVHIFSENELYDHDDAELGTYTPVIREMIDFNCVNGTLNVKVDHSYLATTVVSNYYGLQTDGQPYFENVYMGNSEDGGNRLWGSEHSSGAKSVYGEANVFCQAKTDGSQIQTMWLDTSYGLGSERNANINIDTDYMFTTTIKGYFRLLRSKTYYAGFSTSWRGGYAWYKRPSGGSTNVLYQNTIEQKNKVIFFCGLKQYTTSTTGLLAKNIGMSFNRIDTSSGAVWDSGIRLTNNRFSSGSEDVCIIVEMGK